MARLNSSPLPQPERLSEHGDLYIPMSTSKTTVEHDMLHKVSNNVNEAVTTKRRVDLSSRRRSSAAKAQSVPVKEYEDPAAFVNADQLSPLPGLSSNRASADYTYASYPHSTTSNGLPFSSSPLSCSSSTSFQAWTNPTSATMSRQDSLGNSSLNQKFNMFRLGSQASNTVSDCGYDKLSQNQTLNANHSDEDVYNFPNPMHDIVYAGGGIDNPTEISQNMPLHAGFPDPTKELDFMEQASSAQFHELMLNQFAAQRNLTQPMQRQTSSASRRIEPKPEISQPMSRKPSLEDAPQMVKVTSSDGSSKTAIKLEPAPANQRPVQDKINCKHAGCKKTYRGINEMNRHITRDHEDIKTVYVCVPRADNPNFLAQCKYCTSFKQYNADYNAGEHLRRIHYVPRPSGKKRGQIPPHEKRGGKSGGDWPAMAELRKHMLIFEVNKKKQRITKPRKVDEHSDLLMPEWAEHDLPDDVKLESDQSFDPTSSVIGLDAECDADADADTMTPNDTACALESDLDNASLGSFNDPALYDANLANVYFGLDEFLP